MLHLPPPLVRVRIIFFLHFRMGGGEIEGVNNPDPVPYTRTTSLAPRTNNLTDDETKHHHKVVPTTSVSQLKVPRCTVRVSIVYVL